MPFYAWTHIYSRARSWTLIGRRVSHTPSLMVSKARKVFFSLKMSSSFGQNNHKNKILGILYICFGRCSIYWWLSTDCLLSFRVIFQVEIKLCDILIDWRYIYKTSLALYITVFFIFFKVRCLETPRLGGGKKGHFRYILAHFPEVIMQLGELYFFLITP